jgi:hypothetical protein
MSRANKRSTAVPTKPRQEMARQSKVLSPASRPATFNHLAPALHPEAAQAQRPAKAQLHHSVSTRLQQVFQSSVVFCRCCCKALGRRRFYFLFSVTLDLICDVLFAYFPFFTSTVYKTRAVINEPVFSTFLKIIACEGEWREGALLHK